MLIIAHTRYRSSMKQHDPSALRAVRKQGKLSFEVFSRGRDRLARVDDGVWAGIAPQAAEQVVDPELEHGRPCLDRCRANMRQDDRPRLAEQRLAGQRRLLFQNVE